MLVDVALSAPDWAELVATAEDGSSLLVVHGWHAATRPGTDINAGSSSYFAVLDAQHACLTETLSLHAIDAASGTGTTADALEALASPAVPDEIRRAFLLARRFGLRTLGPVAFGADEGFVVVEANNALYVRSGGPSARFVHHPAGTSAVLAASPDGSRIAFGNCGSPCAGVYAPALLDPKTQAVRRFRSGSAHEFYWGADGTLFFTHDDRTPGQFEGTKVCLSRLTDPSARPSRVACFPSRITSTTISAASPRGRYLGMRLESGTNAGGSSFVVLEMPGAAEVQRVAGSLTTPAVDERGRVAWSRLETSHYRVHVATRGAAEAVLPDARSVGFLPDGAVLVMPVDRPVDRTREPLRTLRDGACGFFSVWKP